MQYIPLEWVLRFVMISISILASGRESFRYAFFLTIACSFFNYSEVKMKGKLECAVGFERSDFGKSIKGPA